MGTRSPQGRRRCACPAERPDKGPRDQLLNGMRARGDIGGGRADKSETPSRRSSKRRVRGSRGKRVPSRGRLYFRGFVASIFCFFL